MRIRLISQLEAVAKVAVLKLCRKLCRQLCRKQARNFRYATKFSTKFPTKRARKDLCKSLSLANANAACPCRTDHKIWAVHCKPERRWYRLSKRRRRVAWSVWSSRNAGKAFLPIASNAPGLRCRAGTSHNEIRKSACAENSRRKEKSQAAGRVRLQPNPDQNKRVARPRD